jgi:hypothetical protein
MSDLITWLRAQLTIDDRGLRDWLSNLPADSGAADWVRQWLADIDAKRRILDHADVSRERGKIGPSPGDGAWFLTVRLLALPYAERSGYDEAWRP